MIKRRLFGSSPRQDSKVTEGKEMRLVINWDLVKHALVCSLYFSPAISLATAEHLELDLSTDELRQHLQEQGKKQGKLHWNESNASKNLGEIGPQQNQVLLPPSIDRGLKWGDRLSQWIKQENVNRSEEKKLRLTDPKLRRGIPPESPGKYSPQTISDGQSALFAEAQASFIQVLEGKGAFPSSLPWDDDTFINWARKVDRIYKQSARYKMLSPNITYYRAQKIKDIRGYLFLKKNNIDAQALRNFVNWEENKKAEVKVALLGLCFNNTAVTSICQAEWNTNEQSVDGPAKFYTKYHPRAHTIYQNFFKIPSSAVRADLDWSMKRQSIAILPFDLPTNKNIHDYLQINIEDEFRWLDWSLHLDFGNYPDAPRVVFKAGATPHVNQLGGNQIIMDANQSIEEYESKWTIRHEFGHVLGLPDCYIEFYDDQEQAFVNYQIDITDLMCSRAGNMNQRIYEELKSNYLKN